MAKVIQKDNSSNVKAGSKSSSSIKSPQPQLQGNKSKQMMQKNKKK